MQVYDEYLAELQGELQRLNTESITEKIAEKAELISELGIEYQMRCRLRKPKLKLPSSRIIRRVK